MSDVVAYVAAALCFLIGTGIAAYLAFRVGYNLGWDERQRDMTVPPLELRKTTRRLDHDAEYHQHTAIDPTSSGRTTSLP